MKRPMIFLALALSTGAVLAESAAVSGKHEGEWGDRHAKAEARFNEADNNHDGKLNFAEMQAAEQRRLKERFDRLDANHDGGVSLAEMRQAHEHRGEMRQHRHGRRQEMHEKLQSLDVDHDKALTKQEIGAAFPKLTENFDRLDANHDGKLTREEMHAMHRMHHGEEPHVAPPAGR